MQMVCLHGDISIDIRRCKALVCLCHEIPVDIKRLLAWLLRSLNDELAI